MLLKLLFFFTFITLWGDESFSMRFLSYENDKSYYIGEIYQIITENVLPVSYVERPDFQKMLFKPGNEGTFRYDEQTVKWRRKSFLIPLNTFNFSVGISEEETTFSGKLTKDADKLYLNYHFKDKKGNISLNGNMSLSLLKIYLLGSFRK